MKTSQSLLLRAKKDPESEAWFKLVNVYDPLIAGWLRQSGVPDSDVADLSQEVLVALVRGLPGFDHNGRTGAFRNWLRMITIHRCRRYRKQRRRTTELVKPAGIHGPDAHIDMLNQLADPNSELARSWDVEHDRFVLSRILQLIRSEFDDRTFAAFERNVIKGESAAEIARDLNVTRSQIYKFKYRVMSRLHREARGLVDPVDDLDAGRVSPSDIEHSANEVLLQPPNSER